MPAGPESSGLVERPGDPGPAGNASEERTGLCSFRVDALSKSPPVPQHCSDCPEARSPPTVWCWLASFLRLSPRPVHERAALRGTAGWAALSAPVSSTLLSSPTDCRLQAPDSPDCARLLDFSRLHAWLSACRCVGSVRRGLTSALSPLTSTGSAPLCCFDPNFGRNVHRADVRENSDPGKRTCMKSPTLHGEGTPRVCLQRCCLLGTRHGWRKMAAISELKVRRCCSLLVIGGDVV